MKGYKSTVVYIPSLFKCDRVYLKAVQLIRNELTIHSFFHRNTRLLAQISKLVLLDYSRCYYFFSNITRGVERV